MKNNQIKSDTLVNRLTELIKELMRNYELKEESKIVAITENNIPTDDTLAVQYEYQKTIHLGVKFDELSPYDKLIVAKSAINTHNQLMLGEIPAFGKIIKYELVQPDRNCIGFKVTGELIEEEVDFYI